MLKSVTHHMPTTSVFAPQPDSASLAGRVGQRRSGGVDMMRVVAAFWVIYTHSGTISSIVPGATSSAVGGAFSFHVPFFLLASLYFLALSLSKDPNSSSFAAWWNRSRKLMVLHLIWVGIYTMLHMVQAIVRHQSAAQVLADPVGFLLGGAAVHLYFIPLLLCGQFVLWGMLATAGRRRSPAPGGGGLGWMAGLALAILLGLLLLLKAWLARSGNGFNLATMHAFVPLFPNALGNQVGRVFLILAAHAIRCGPLVILAILLAHLLPAASAKNSTRYMLLGLSFAMLCALRWCPGSVYEEASALSSFTFAYLLPLPSCTWTQQAGRFALGIYLAHQIPLEALDLLLSRSRVHIAGAAALPALLACSAVSLAACWLVLLLVERKARGLKPAFGL